MSIRTYRVAHFFAGAGGSVAGYRMAQVEAAVGVRARFETVLAVDCWDTALETCARMNGCGVHLFDLFDAENYALFHGSPPPDGWLPMTPADLRRLCPEAPDVVFGSPPCKGFSRLLGGKAARSKKYKALNSLVFRWLWLCLEAWPDQPPRLVLMENVPDIADVRRRKKKRGEALVEKVEKLLGAYGYASRRTEHDCGPLGGLAQHRNRFLLIARHVERCPALLYEPFEMPMQTIGDVIADLPVPCFENTVPMHDLPRITDKTARRLAFVEPGRDWRSIESTWQSAEGWTLVDRGDGCRLLLPTTGGRVDVEDPRATRAYHNRAFAVVRLGDASGTVTGGGRPSNGAFTVGDPRLGRVAFNDHLRLAGWPHRAPCVTSGNAGGVADPRLNPSAGRHSTKFSVKQIDEQAGTVTGAAGGDHTAQVADPRLTCTPNGATLRVLPVDGPSPTVTGTSGVWSSGSVQVADPRPNRPPRNGAFGVQQLDGTSATITGVLDVHNGPAALGDPRPALTCSPIISPWGLWHRPFTARELADLQSFPRVGADGAPLLFAGGVTDQRMQIGNAVPPLAARAVAEQMLRTLLCADGVPLAPQGAAIWVRRGRDGVLVEVLTSLRVAPPTACIEGVTT